MYTKATVNTIYYHIARNAAVVEPHRVKPQSVGLSENAFTVVHDAANWLPSPGTRLRHMPSRYLVT